jgi:hypothetical protein
MGTEQTRKNDKRPVGPQINLQQREMVTRYQMDGLLQVLGMTVSSLGHYLRVPTPEDGPKFEPLDPEAKIALENTVIATCDRLQKIMAEDKRWSTEFQDKVEKQYEEALVLQQEVLKMQYDASKEVTSPHFRCRPLMIQLSDGSWMAYLGNLDDLTQSIFGIGRTPEAAVIAFDDAYRGVINPATMQWLREQEQKTNEPNLDDNRTSDPNDPPQGGEINPGDSPDPKA